MAVIYNTRSNSLLSGTKNNDIILNGGEWDDDWHDSGSNVTINAFGGNDSIYNYEYGTNSSINSGAGHDSILNEGNNVTISCGDGEDYVKNGNDDNWRHYGADNTSISGGKGNEQRLHSKLRREFHN